MAFGHVSQLFRNHLRLILLHEFPEHYGEVLSAVLKGSESQNLSLDVWRDLLGALSGKPKSNAPVHPSKIRDEIRHYATEQRLLSRQEVCFTNCRSNIEIAKIIKFI